MISLGPPTAALLGGCRTRTSGFMETSVSGLFAAVRIKCAADNGDRLLLHRCLKLWFRWGGWRSRSMATAGRHLGRSRFSGLFAFADGDTSSEFGSLK